MFSINHIERNNVSSSASTSIIISANFKQSKSEGQRRFKHCKSVDDTQHFLDNFLCAKPKGKQQRAKTKGMKHPSVEEREHLYIQNDLYLEELKIDHVDEKCQIDPVLDQSESSLFLPALTGIDAATQIYPGNLLDFDREVHPFLDHLVNETVERSLAEISLEDSHKQLGVKQVEFDTLNSAEILEYLRLKEDQRRSQQEKKAKLEEHEKVVLLEEEMTKKVAACVFAQDYLSGLLPKVYRRLERQGYFITQDAEIQDVEENFWPWLIDEVDTEIQTLQTSYNLIDTLIDDSVSKISQESVVEPSCSRSSMKPEEPLTVDNEMKEWEPEKQEEAEEKEEHETEEKQEQKTEKQMEQEVELQEKLEAEEQEGQQKKAQDELEQNENIKNDSGDKENIE